MSQSLHDRIHRALGAQEIENIKTRHAYLHAKSHSYEEWSELWAYTDDVTWAHSFGRMVGWDEMYYGSVEKYDRDMLSLYNTMVKKNPHIIGKDFLAACLGGLHSLASGVIEVAEDGMSARSFFLTPGTLCACNMPSLKRDGAMCWERYGSDFVYKDGKWWYLHEHVCPDINFTGSIEARDITRGDADVIVCEAFTGNVILKFYEGVGKTLLNVIKSSLMGSLRGKLGGLLIKPILKESMKAFDASEYGGAPLLGLNGLVVKTHEIGRASCRERV